MDIQLLFFQLWLPELLLIIYSTELASFLFRLMANVISISLIVWKGMELKHSGQFTRWQKRTKRIFTHRNGQDQHFTWSLDCGRKWDLTGEMCKHGKSIYCGHRCLMHHGTGLFVPLNFSLSAHHLFWIILKTSYRIAEHSYKAHNWILRQNMQKPSIQSPSGTKKSFSLVQGHEYWVKGSILMVGKIQTNLRMTMSISADTSTTTLSCHERKRQK